MKTKLLTLILTLTLVTSSITPASSGISAAVILPVLATIAESVAQMTSMVAVIDEQYNFFKEKEEQFSKVRNVLKTFKSFEEMVRISRSITSTTSNVVRILEKNPKYLRLNDVIYVSEQVTRTVNLTSDIMSFGKEIFADDTLKMSDAERFAQTQEILKSIRTSLVEIQKTEISLTNLNSIMNARRIL